MVLSVSERTFTQEVLESPIPVLVNFWAPWCGACQRISPLILQLQTSCHEQIKLVRINADENFRLCNTYQLKTLPTLILMENAKVRHRLEGSLKQDELRQALETIKTTYNLQTNYKNGRGSASLLLDCDYRSA